MTKQQQQPAIPRYVPIPGEAETSDQFYERLAREKGAANLAKSAAIPSWDGLFTAPPAQEPEKEPPAWASYLLPANDPMRQEAKRKRFNGEG